MFTLYSKGCEYTIRALICGLELQRDHGFRVTDACQKAEVPESFTRKGFQRLANQNLLKTHRGPGGGYQLSRNPSHISIFEIIKIIDGQAAYERCVMGLDQCFDKAPCPLHKIWKKMKAKLVQELTATTLQQMIHASKSKKKPQSAHAKP